MPSRARVTVYDFRKSREVVVLVDAIDMIVLPDPLENEEFGQLYVGGKRIDIDRKACDLVLARLRNTSV